MKQTTNYKLKKPDYADVADIADINANMDILDKELKEHTHTKTQVGLGNVDNTADKDKNVLSATKLTTARKINNVSFNGTGDIAVLANPQQNQLNNEDLNNVVDCGFYFTAGGNTVTNFPVGAGATDSATTIGGSTLIVAQSGGASRIQIFANNKGMWFRVSNTLTSKTWLDWIYLSQGGHTHNINDIDGLSKINRGIKGYILTGQGNDADATWEEPCIAKDTGNRSTRSNAAKEATGVNSSARGYNTIASGNNSCADGSETIASGLNSYASGYLCKASGSFSSASGVGNEAKNYQTVIGKYATVEDGPTSVDDTSGGSIFTVGIGQGDTSRSNAFRIANNGNCYGKSAFKASGADFAEYFEWADGNFDNEDRRGLFVTLDCEKIRLAKADDYILGVVSATPTITGDTQSEAWKDMYLKDIFGVFLTEEVTVPEITNEETGEIVPEHTETRFIINPDYNSEKQYSSRDKRKEWEAIGLIGKLIVVDDGTCIANGYCNVSNGGIATKSNEGYRVMSRLDSNHIKIILK